MAEYIDKKTVIDTLDGLCDIVCQYSKKQRAFMCGACNLGSAFDVLQELPAADVRPVVLCRDCIHLSGITNGGIFFRCDRYDRWQDESNRVYMPLDGFCCYGQKKGDES